MTQQTLTEKIEQLIKDNATVYICAECKGSGSDGAESCSECSGTGLEGWQLDYTTKAILQQVIEWVDKEVIGEDEELIDKEWLEKHKRCYDINVHRNELRATQRQKLQQLKGEV